MKKMYSFLVFLVLAGSMQVFAQSGVGKLIGKVVDAATKEAIIGANVIITGTKQGAATDAEGRYFVLNIVPGTYEVKVSYVGYGSKVLRDVRIVAGITYELNVELRSDLQLEDVVITGKKFFEERSTNTVKVLDADQINKLPVKGVEKLASLQAGVVMNEGSGGSDRNATINVRGGRGGEVLYIIDGVPQNNIYDGGNSAQVSNSAIDQLSFQIGGYEAKYGQAQSGIINVTTKTGDPTYTIFSDVLSSSFTDDYGYNLYTLNFGGPFVPGNGNHTFFLSGERGWFADSDPRAIDLVIPTVKYSSPTLPNNNAGVWRYTARTFHNLSPFMVRLGANVNMRDGRDYTHTYSKWNSQHNPRTVEKNYSYSARISQTVSNNAYWNLNIGYKKYDREAGDGLFFDQYEKYGDTLYAPYFTDPETGITSKAFTALGSRAAQDNNSLFYKFGRVSNSYTRRLNDALTLNAEFTYQLGKHQIEGGVGGDYNILRYYGLAPARVAVDMRGPSEQPFEYRVALASPYFFGFDITGRNTANETKTTVFNLNAGKTDTKAYETSVKPKNPMNFFGYVQDKYELNDMVLNLGLRFDYFSSKADVLKDETNPYGYGDPANFDNEDFKIKEAEFYLSPRIGIGFPVTSGTVFHAQFGKFIQSPNLIDVYTSVSSLDGLLTDNNFGVNTGNVNSEVTTQYEIGFRQVVGDNMGSLQMTAFYKNTKGLVNDAPRFFDGVGQGGTQRYYGPKNTDFGTVKGLAASLQLSRMSFFSLSVDYTYSLAEGTGSSTSSAGTAVFRNQNGEAPKVIAPLDFDQRHTGIVNLDFTVPKGELGWFENFSANLLFSFQSGRPYTPVSVQNIAPGGETNLGETRGYINSAYGPSTARIDLKVEKQFSVFGAQLTPYVVVENLLDAENAISIYRSTGSPYTSGYLLTTTGRKTAAGKQSYIDDYQTLERNPDNFGIPRTIKLGFRMRFAGINL